MYVPHLLLAYPLPHRLSLAHWDRGSTGRHCHLPPQHSQVELRFQVPRYCRAAAGLSGYGNGIFNLVRHSKELVPGSDVHLSAPANASPFTREGEERCREVFFFLHSYKRGMIVGIDEGRQQAGPQLVISSPWPQDGGERA